MDDIVTLTHRNVCKDGFTVLDEVDAGNVSPSPLIGLRLISDFAVFLDLPAPWEAIEHAKKALRVRLCFLHAGPYALKI
jgi:tRNA (adenine57-N1/adenine58-N1)-methyltransferase